MIRTALISDAPALAAVQALSWQETYAGLLPERVITARTNVATLADAAQKRLQSAADQRVFLAEDSGYVYGFIWLAASEERERKLVGLYDQHMYALYVVKRKQREGLGRALILTAAAEMQAREYHSLSLEVLATNPARRFYEHLGAKLISSMTIRDGNDSWEQCAYAWSNVADIR